MSEQTTQKKCTKVKRLTGAHIRIEPRDAGYVDWRWENAQEIYAKRLEEWAKEFEQFIRDHRSQDVNSVYVEREYEEQCSACGCTWEVDYVPTTPDKNGHNICLGCGAEQEV